MNANKIYTAQELREMEAIVASEGISPMMCETIAKMLRQAADDASRLEAVVKECEKQIPECRLEDCKCNPTDSGYCDGNCHDKIIVYEAVTAILRVACGNAKNEGV